MKIIIQEYGKAILTSLAAVLILVFCLYGIVGTEGEQGIFALLQKYASNAGRTYQLYEDREVYHSVIQRNPPTIEYIGQDIHAGEKVKWQSLFLASDADKRQTAVQVISVDENQIEDTSYIFPQSGTYEILVSAKDEYGITAWKYFHIPVQRRKENA